jgi:3',5'-cyclic AMP phosphodiesterase CpdA
MVVVAHLSDPHLPTPRGSRFFTLANKRLFGLLSWRLRRSAIHRSVVLAALVQDLKSAGADHVVVTGDLVNISQPSEFRAAAAWLADLGGAEDVTVVPGNHDAYVALPWAESLAFWAPFMTGDGAGRPIESLRAFPFVRRRGDLALIGLTTAEPSEPGMAYGRVGADQLRRLADLLDTTGRDGLFRIVLIHHPPLGLRVPRRKRLLDADAFGRVLARHGAELVLHGHNHRFDFGFLAGPAADIPVVGTPSASSLPEHGVDVAQYNLYRVDRRSEGWTLDIRRRVFDPASGRLSETPFRVLSLPPSGGRRAEHPSAVRAAPPASPLTSSAGKAAGSRPGADP